MERHKARLQAELTKCRIRRGCATIEELKKRVAEGARRTDVESLRPRWVRVNRFKSSLQQQMPSTLSAYKEKPTLGDVTSASLSQLTVHVDLHIPDLLALPPGTELTKTQAYKKGELVLQDKASCFPAYLLLGDSEVYDGGDLLDACAAPGNKTTHLVSLLSQKTIAAKSPEETSKPKVFACERDTFRSELLEKMVTLAGARDAVSVLAKQDFLALDPKDARFANVTHLLLDPSCSGSGIVGRDEMPVLQLPEDPKLRKVNPVPANDKASGTGLSKKRKRQTKSESKDEVGRHATNSTAQTSDLENDNVFHEVDYARLERLANLQTKIIEHAFSFPAARRITYSTCSIHVQENEAVVARALGSEVARQRGWRIMRREEQPDGLRRWPRRGLELRRQGNGTSGPAGKAVVRGLSQVEVEACIRCEAGNEDGTMGFFVCGFVRDGAEACTENSGTSEIHTDREMASEEGEKEWEGFSGDERT